MSATSTGTAASRPGRRWSARRERAFLEALERTLNVAESARIAGVTATNAYDRKRRDKVFAEAWRRALDVGYGEVELALMRQALSGSERTETVLDAKDGQVRQIKTVRTYPETMAVRLLLAHRAEVEAYRRANMADDDPDDAIIQQVREEMSLLRERYGGVVLDVKAEPNGEGNGEAT